MYGFFFTLMSLVLSNFPPKVYVHILNYRVGIDRISAWLILGSDFSYFQFSDYWYLFLLLIK